MPKITLRLFIKAPIYICFDLARSIDLHKISTGNTQEEAIAGTTSGLIGLNETVTWRATHFGVRQKLTSRITEMQPPSYFVDEMEKGVFKRIWHKHTFEETAEGTLMTDEFDYEAPLGFLGDIANVLFLKNYLHNLLLVRNQIIKEYAENGRWKEILPYQEKFTE